MSVFTVKVQVCQETVLNLSFLVCDQGLLDPTCLPWPPGHQTRWKFIPKTCPSRQMEMLPGRPGIKSQ